MSKSKPVIIIGSSRKNGDTAAAVNLLNERFDWPVVDLLDELDWFASLRIADCKNYVD